MSDRSADPVRVGGTEVGPGQRARLEIPVARLPTDTWMSLPVMVVNGVRPGPGVWLTAAVHGDELNGVEIVRRVLGGLDPSRMAGHVVAAPIVNVFGFVNESRYLPDRRDLNRSFPGSTRGSLAARLASLVLGEIVGDRRYGIDLHTGADHRFNLPQVRAHLDDPETARIATSFGAPVVIHSKVRDGSLREAATAGGGHVLLYEGGESNRFDPAPINTGVRGVLNVLGALDMIDPPADGPTGEPLRVDSTRWVRARRGGILRLHVGVGDRVERGQTIGEISDAFEAETTRVRSTAAGIVIGHTRHPLVSQGDAVAHVAEVSVGVGDAAEIRRHHVARAPFARQR